jgi:Mrp family chromosome partitioning ATPase
VEKKHVRPKAEDRKAQIEVQRKIIQERLQHIQNKILVMSGKGGVGKSSVAAYLSVALAQRNYRVGLMDVDLHGPSISRLLGIAGHVCACRGGGSILPVSYLPNLEVVSMETLTGGQDAATIWRGPLKGAAIRQFIADIEWGQLDYLVIDSPPGTGDEPLTVAQTIPDARALIVTTPQEIALADVRKSIHFCRQVRMDILGLVENMSGLTCPHCGALIDLFKSHGGIETARKENLRCLGCLPLEPEVVQSGDLGRMPLLENKTHAFARAFEAIVDTVEGLTRHQPDATTGETLEHVSH